MEMTTSTWLGQPGGPTTASVRSARIGTVYTGVTIACEVDAGSARLSRTGRVVTLVADLAATAGLDLIARQPLHVCSEDLLPADWLTIAGSVRALVEAEAVDGVLVLHGTDTAAYTAAALSFLLADLQVPIVVTGANRPPDHPASDAGNNVAGALTALRHLPRGVYLSFAGTQHGPSLVHLGTRVRKQRASGTAYASTGRAVVGVVDGELRLVDVPQLPAAPRGRDDLDAAVAGLRCHPGFDFGVLSPLVGPVLRGIVVELYPCATGPTRGRGTSLPRFVERSVAQGCPVIATVFQQPADGLDYDSGRAIVEAGAQLLPDVLPETATVKLMWALGQSRYPDEVAVIMERSIAGERQSAATVAGGSPR